MTDEKWLIIGSDPRLKQLAMILSQENRSVFYKNSDEWNRELKKICQSYKPNRIIFPIQPLKLTDETFDETCCTSSALLFVGRTSDGWREMLSKTNFAVMYYLQDEEFIWRNARLTAEGFIAAFYEIERQTIEGKRFYVTGFGRVAKMVSTLLQSMGASVVILARASEQIFEAKAYGYEAEFLYASAFHKEVDYIINTIPAKWFTTEMAEECKPMVKLFDLASAPGCLAFSGIPSFYYRLLPGLPARYFPVDAVGVLAQAIESYNGKLEEE